MKQRDSYFDNAKFILIFLVVFGHIIRSYIEKDPVILSLYKTIYTFHMPAFILLAGFFAKGFYKKGYIQKLAKKLILPYIVFQLIYTVYYYFLYDSSTLEVDPLTPHWSLWFLISLFCWNAMLYAFIKWFKFGTAAGLTVAFSLGLIVGFADSISSTLSLSRTFVFFPMFLLGYYLKKEHFDYFKTSQMRLAAGLTFILVFLGMFLVPEFSDKWLLGSKPYGDFDWNNLYGMGIRAAVYALNIIMIFSFFSFVPTKQQFFTKWGKNTLYVYLLHGFLVRLFRVSALKDEINPTTSILVMLGVSLVLTMLFSTKFFTSLTQPLIEFRTSRFQKLFSKKEINTR
ncbi:acyltransferase family protein [Rossellomorea marisflavi]|uniref:Acyltransferase n=1 Tax=Rossellomorea marisflavi TaxID=189381 RepID=A0A0J5SI85_9BACI|nr:acyltransferase family protein [Rossellomorea marisflavi]KMK96723.1 acyltransferase [Rossellomorea marisflavi]KML06236.1 acyltransferase [Rossellomorea marisflavi]KML32623.1 acyltransferase [Rossellomorea marisflavi]KZE49602.1 acyltransferase [Rossellomorea marisflavi]MCM2603708.1 acyltransferase family protein [Rossellomorea marisflavi]